jgi:hypothetical protein
LAGPVDSIHLAPAPILLFCRGGPCHHDHGRDGTNCPPPIPSLESTQRL